MLSAFQQPLTEPHLPYIITIHILYFYGGEQAAPAGVAGLVVLLLHWIESQKLARSFGKGFGSGLLLFFFGRLARVVLGLSSAEYVGKH